MPGITDVAIVVDTVLVTLPIPAPAPPIFMVRYTVSVMIDGSRVVPGTTDPAMVVAWIVVPGIVDVITAVSLSPVGMADAGTVNTVVEYTVDGSMVVPGTTEPGTVVPGIVVPGMVLGGTVRPGTTEVRTVVISAPFWPSDGVSWGVSWGFDSCVDSGDLVCGDPIVVVPVVSCCSS